MTSRRVIPCWASRYAAWQSGSRKIAASTWRPSTSSLPADCTCAAARWSTRWKASVCSGGASTPGGSRSTTAASSSSAAKTCSTVRNSWRRRRASRTAKVSAASSERASRIPSRLLDRAAQRELVLAGERHHLGAARLGDLARVDARHADAGAVDVEHDLGRRGLVVVEDRHQHPDDELHRRVVVVVEEDLVPPRPRDLLDRPRARRDARAALFLDPPHDRPD